ncbi:radical SAM protein [Candidatus Lokiarchaeum ossiferum]|uniref:radical SAM protein n=1 Tax=Candidatus Lokiarchaeum ossiferum TaxID=2951803 RepID=UPI00352CF7D1
MDILFIFVSGQIFQGNTFSYHLGASYIISYLKKNNFSASQMISPKKLNISECINIISKIAPKIVGFTIYDTNYLQSVAICKKLKQDHPEIITIFGGPTATIQASEIVEKIPEIDICIRNEGEETALEILTELKKYNFILNKKKLKNIEGVSFKIGGRVISTQNKDILSLNKKIDNFIDKYPSPYLSKIIPPQEASNVGIISARGCNQNCTYCNCAVLYKKNIFTHSLERVIQEIEYLSHFQHKKPISILDDAFTIFPKRAEKICKEIIRKNIKINLACITRCDKINEDLLHLMKNAGFTSIGFSLESSSPHILRNIGKVNPSHSKSDFKGEIQFIEQLQKMTRYAKKIGFKDVFVSIMVGLPGETLEEAQNTINVVENLDINSYQLNKFRIMKGTPIYDDHKKFDYNISYKGLKNHIFIENSHPFQIEQLQFSKKAELFKISNEIDFNVAKTLSLFSRSLTYGAFFKSIIIDSDILKKLHVKWLQENIAINGNFIQLYSNEDTFKSNYKKNISTFYDNFPPTIHYEHYIWTKTKKSTILDSSRLMMYGKSIKNPIRILKMENFHQKYQDHETNFKNIIVVDVTNEDSKKMIQFLKEIKNSDDAINYLLERKLLPHFQNLCPWSKEDANCNTFDKAIISKDNSIRLCWRGNSIGNLDDNYVSLRKKVATIKSKVEKKRNCKFCNQINLCTKCFLIDQSSQEEFCWTNQNFDLKEAVNAIKSIEIIQNELLS